MDRVTRTLAVAATLSVAAWLPASLVAAGGPSIEGSYRLTRRVLPDGKEVKAPDVAGFMTYTKKDRNFNVTWLNPDGKRTSLSYIAEYTLSPTKYCEKPIYWMQNNLMAPGIKYDPPAEKAECSDVTMKDGTLSFAIKGEPPVLTVSPTGVVATAKGMFTDYWEKVQ